MSAPERIWAKLDRATVYMDGSSPLVASTREFNGAAEYVTVSTQNRGNLNQTHPDGWLVIGPQDDKRVVLDAMKYNPTNPAFWYGGQIPDDASIHPLFASTDAVNGDLLVAALPDEDDIEQAITDSIDLDWTPRDAAKAVMRLLQTGENREAIARITDLEAKLAEIDAHRRKVIAENERQMNAMIEKDRRISALEATPPAPEVTEWREITEDDQPPRDVPVLMGCWEKWPRDEWVVEFGLYGSTKGGWIHGRVTHWLPSSFLPSAPALTAAQEAGK